MNWNILAGGGTRVSMIATQILDKNPTLCVLTEYRLGISGTELKAALHQRGYIHSIEPETERSKNSAAIFSQEPLDPNSLPLEIPENIRPYIVTAEFKGVCLIGVFCATPQVGVSVIDFLRRLAIRDPQKSFVVVGDFFFGPRLSDPNYGKRLHSLKDGGWVNAWDSERSGEEFWSCQTSRGKSRPDHFYLHGPISRKLHVVESFPKPLTERLSDHAPITASFHMSPINPDSTKWPG